MSKQPYLSYLLRLWQSSAGDKTTWRASLEDPMTGERRGFDSLETLLAFLEAQTNDQVGSQPEIDAGCSVVEN